MRMRFVNEFYQVYKSPDSQINRLKWAGYEQRINDDNRKNSELQTRFKEESRKTGI